MLNTLTCIATRAPLSLFCNGKDLNASNFWNLFFMIKFVLEIELPVVKYEFRQFNFRQCFFFVIDTTTRRDLTPLYIDAS